MIFNEEKRGSVKRKEKLEILQKVPNKAHNYLLEIEPKFIIQIALNSLTLFRRMFMLCVKLEYTGITP